MGLQTMALVGLAGVVVLIVGAILLINKFAN